VSAEGKRAAYIQGLRMLADALERHESIPLPFEGGSRDFCLNVQHLHSATADSLAALVRSLGGTGWQQRTVRGDHGMTYLYVTGHIAGLWVQIQADADEVCEPIEPQPVIERKCPALDALIAEAQEGGTS
jgi:hypothetical protein